MLETNLSRLVVVGDRVLIRPTQENEQTKSGLFLPPGVEEKEDIRRGYVMKVGPGYPLPMPGDDVLDSWKDPEEKVKYIPLQVKEGDLAIFLKKNAYEVVYEEVKYFVVSQASILMLERQDW